MYGNLIPVESIQERDVDLILLEELNTDNTFCEWFVSELSLPVLTSAEGAWKSISAFGLGETDILFSYKSLGKKVFVLIENKLDASFQESQFERYEKRANKYLSNRECDITFSVLFAPNQYCEAQNEFDHYFTYEMVANRLDFTGSKRNLFKSKLLKIAVEKLRRGRKNVINDSVVQKFWLEYWEYQRAYIPEFYFPKPAIVPFNSDWLRLKHDLLKKVKFCHKLSQGHVDVEFYSFQEGLENSIEQLNFPENITLAKLNKTFVLRVEVKRVDRTRDFNSQKYEITEGLQAMLHLKDFIIKSNLLK